jgi:hypothetical protein
LQSGLLAPLKNEIEKGQVYIPDQLINRLTEGHKLAMQELEAMMNEKRLTQEEVL